MRLFFILLALCAISIPAYAASENIAAIYWKTNSSSVVCDGTYQGTWWNTTRYNAESYIAFKLNNTGNGTLSNSIVLGINGSLGLHTVGIKLVRLTNGTFMLTNLTNDIQTSLPQYFTTEVCAMTGACTVELVSQYITSYQSAHYDFSDYGVGTCATPSVKRYAFRNGTASWVLIDPTGIPASLTYNCSVNASSSLSDLAQKSANGTAYGTNTTITFTAGTDIANTTEQFGTGACVLSNGTALTFSNGHTWTWGYNLELWRIADVNRNIDHITLMPTTSWLYQPTTGFRFRVISAYDHMDHAGVHWLVANFTYNASCGGLASNVTTFILRDEEGIYSLEFIGGNLQCNSSTTVNVTVSAWKNWYDYSTGVAAEATSDIQIPYNSSQFTIDNIQAWNNTDNNVDFWATVSTKYTRTPIPAAASLACNLTLANTTVYAGTLVSDYDSEGNLKWTHMRFDANLSSVPEAAYGTAHVDCEASGYASQAQNWQFWQYAQYLTRIHMCGNSATDSASIPGVYYYLKDDAYTLKDVLLLCVVQGEARANETRLHSISSTSGEDATIESAYVLINQNAGTAGGEAKWMGYESSKPFNPSPYAQIYRHVEFTSNTQFTERNLTIETNNLFIADEGEDQPEMMSQAKVDMMIFREPGLMVGPATFVISNKGTTNSTNYSILELGDTAKCTIDLWDSSQKPSTVVFNIHTAGGRACGSENYEPVAAFGNVTGGVVWHWEQVVEHIGDDDNSECNSTEIVEEGKAGTALVCDVTVSTWEYVNGVATYATTTRSASIPMEFSGTPTADDWEPGRDWLGETFGGFAGYFFASTTNALTVILGLVLIVAAMPIIVALLRAPPKG